MCETSQKLDPVGFSLVAAVLFVAITAPLAYGQDQPESQLSASQILERTDQVYASCKSYVDSGVVKTVFFQNTGPRETIIEFSTAFRRPADFRFEFVKKPRTDRQLRSIVWRKGTEVRTWWNPDPGIQGQDSFMWAIAGSAGISGGSSFTVTRLLLPDETTGKKLTELVEPERLSDGKVSDADCYRVRGAYGSGEVTVWVEKDSFLIRQIEKSSEPGGVRTNTVTTYSPTLDSAIPDETLEFNPPTPE